MFTLENIFQFFSIVGIFVLGWYTWETYRLRKNSEKQLKASVRPVLHILDNVIYCNNYLLYCYYNVAFNVKIFIQTEKGIFSLSGKEYNIITHSAEPQELNAFLFGKIEVSEKDSHKKLFDYVKGKNWTSFLIYGDLYQNRLFTLHYTDESGEKVIETKYLDEI